MRCRNILVVLSLLLGFVRPSDARRIEHWPFDRLLRESDLIVIANPVTSAETGEKMFSNTWDTDLLTVKTSFKIEAVLKGVYKKENLDILHLRLPTGVKVSDGPLFVSFRTGPCTIRTDSGRKISIGAPTYLLFLKEFVDGRYEFVSGRIDPELSVQEMHQPIKALDPARAD
jgi:hypothetical protein